MLHTQTASQTSSADGSSVAAGEHSPIVSVQEFFEETYETPEPLLAPWLRRGDLSMVYAPTGVGKTWFTLGVAWAVASGGEFGTWNGHAYRRLAKPHRVLVVDFEMAVQELQARLQSVRQRASLSRYGGSEQEALRNLSIYAVTREEPGTHLADLSTPEDCHRLLQMTRAFDLIIIDNLTTAMKPEDENRPDAFFALQDALISLRRQNKAVILVHHTNKGGDQRGSSSKTTMLNTVLSLTRTEYREGSGLAISVRFVKHRNLVGEEKAPVDIWTEQDDQGREIWKARRSNNDRVEAVARWMKSDLCANQSHVAELVSAEAGTLLDQRRVSELFRNAKERGLINDAQWKAHSAAAKKDCSVLERRAKVVEDLRGVAGWAGDDAVLADEDDDVEF